MKDYEIIIKVSDAGDVYNAKNIEDANKIAQSECDNIYARLRGRCSVTIESIKEVNDTK